MRPRNLVRGWRGWFAFVRAFGLTALVLLLTGCVQTLAPIDFSCKGKIGLTLTGSMAGGMMYGGGGINTATIQGDCAEGFTWKRAAQPEAEKPK